MTKEDKIDYILDNFDFDKVHRVMKALKWTYKNTEQGYSVPNIHRLLKKAKGLLESISTAGSFHSSGGFEASIDSNGIMALKFIVSEWDTRYHGEEES